MRDIFDKIENKEIKVCFGLEAQGYISKIKSIIKRWNDGFKKDFPDEEPLDMSYSKHVWDEIGKEIGWCPFTAALNYFEWLHSEEGVENIDKAIKETELINKVREVMK